jgi:tetratricopeptide (TPR) repeat protein
MAKKKRKKSARNKPASDVGFISLYRRLRFPLLLIAIALIPRLIALFDLTDSPVFLQPVLDEETYHQTALQIASGDVIGSRAFWQAPLYPYFLGLIYAVVGVNIFAAKLIQILLSAINCYLLFRLSERVFDRRVAWLAFGIAVFFGPFIFFATSLLAPTLINLLTLAALLLLTSYSEDRSNIKILLAGFLLGLAQIGHGMMVAFVPFVVLWMLLSDHNIARIRNALPAVGLLLAGFISVVIVTAVRNYAVEDELVLVSANFGANFYLGNHPNYDSTTAIRPGLEWDEFIQEAASEGAVTPGQSSSYFSDKAWSNIANDPVAFIGLLFKKAHLLLAGDEIKRNIDIYHFGGYSLLLQMLTWQSILKFPTGLILPLAITWVLVWPFTKGSMSTSRALLLMFALSQAAAILLFFVSTRYRLPIMIPATIFASALIWQCIDLVKSREFLKLGYVAVPLIGMTVCCNLPRYDRSNRDLAENAFYEGLATSRAGDLEGALRKYEEALSLRPDYPMALYNISLIHRRLGHEQEAQDALDELVTRNPNSFMAHLIAGKARLDNGNFAAAESELKSALRINPRSAEALVNLGHLYRTMKDTTQAMSVLRSALSINPKSYKAYNQIGALYYEKGDLINAEANFREAYRLNGTYVSALNNLATVLSSRNRIDEAERLLVRANFVDPTDVSVLLNLGSVKLRKKHAKEALNLFDSAVSLAPRMPQAHHYRGVALASLGQLNEARAAFREALRLDPGFEPARKQLERIGG